MNRAMQPAVRLVRDLESAWNSADGDAYATSFAEDADFVDIRGTHHQGRRAIALGHQEIFDSIYRGSIVKQEVRYAREIAPGCAVVHAVSTLDAPSGALAGTHHAVQTLLIHREDGLWHIAALHNSLVAS
jgi:uncharacterized protein (TIGR02246 family)